MTALLALFARWGVPESVRKPLGWVTAAVTAFALLWLLRAIYDRSVVQGHVAKVEARASADREIAADERMADSAKAATSEKGLHDAISTAPPGGTLSPAAHALACERLRRIGRQPAACGSGGGDGSQAPAR